MNEINKLGPGMYLIVVIALIIAGGLTLSSNPYKSAYQNETPVSYAVADDKEGYPAGDDIPVAKSIEDIKNNEYCTIEVSKKNIESTRVFKIKDRSEAGTKTARVGRKYTTSEIKDVYYTKQSILGDFSYKMRQVKWNLKNTSYGEWCVVTLESNEKVLVFVDLKLLDIKKEEKIKLPIGQVIESCRIGRIEEEYKKYGLEEANTTWYVDMVGNWEENEVGDIDVMAQFTLVFIIAFPVVLIGFYFFIVKRDKKIKVA